MRHNSLARRGMSLLEILVTLFILSVGLLGVAAIIPLGTHAVHEAMKADRSSTCGRAMMREMRIRGWVDPMKWTEHTGSQWIPVVATAPGDATPLVRYRDSYVIDPSFLGAYPAPQMFPPGATDLTAALRRVSIDVNPDPLVLPFDPANPPVPANPFGMTLPSARRHFVWHDDLTFIVPKDADDRPRQTVLWTNDKGSNPWPPRIADGSGIDPLVDDALIAEDSSNYTWMATVTPRIDPANNTGGYSFVDQITQYSVSIVVFYKRDLLWPSNTDPAEPPAERSVQAVMRGGGWGGGDVQLIADSSVDANANATWLNVRKDQWLMLRMLDPGAYPADATDDKIVVNWYRVIAVDPDVVDIVAGTSWSRYVTLSGPDWPMDGPGWVAGNVTTYATLVDDVIGVYTTTVEADLNSAWTQ